MRKRLYLGALAILLGAVGLMQAGCSATYPRRDPTGEVFPTVQGEALDGTVVDLPAVGEGEPMLLLLGYDQDAQFDIDRWLLGLNQAGLQVKAFEVPTIAGMIPRMISGTIDGGMRRGIPEEDWGGVVTVYGDADAITSFTGNEDGLTGRIVLLDGEAKVVFFHDRGYSVGTLRRLEQALEALVSGLPR